MQRKLNECITNIQIILFDSYVSFIFSLPYFNQVSAATEAQNRSKFAHSVCVLCNATKVSANSYFARKQNGGQA